MTENKRFTSFIEDDGYWIRDENNFKIIATGLKFGVAESLIAKLNELAEENQRLTDKLNQTALELVDGVISQGKAVEISEMSYTEFLDYRAENGKPMELQL